MNAHVHTSPDAIYPFDARGVAKRFRHAAIFGALDSLHPGETMRFVNDHDPLPLLQQMQMRYGEAVRESVQQHRERWEHGVGYLERETFDAFLQLPAPQRKLIREVIMTFARVHGQTPQP